MHLKETPKERLEQLVQAELEDARGNSRPISRNQLARHLQSKTGLPLKEAEIFVETYCDEKSPGTPEYLMSEFGISYLKVLSVLNVLAAIGVLVLTLKFQKPNQPLWPGIALGCLFVCVAAFTWVRSIAPEVRRRPESKLSGQALVETDRDLSPK